jgi:hypothetical protein
MVEAFDLTSANKSEVPLIFEKSKDTPVSINLL